MAKEKEKAVNIRGGFYKGEKVSRGKKEKAIMPLKGKSKFRQKREKAVSIY